MSSVENEGAEQTEMFLRRGRNLKQRWDLGEGVGWKEEQWNDLEVEINLPHCFLIQRSRLGILGYFCNSLFLDCSLKDPITKMYHRLASSWGLLYSAAHISPLLWDKTRSWNMTSSGGLLPLMPLLFSPPQCSPPSPHRRQYKDSTKVLLKTPHY